MLLFINVMVDVFVWFERIINEIISIFYFITIGLIEFMVKALIF